MIIIITTQLLSNIINSVASAAVQGSNIEPLANAVTSAASAAINRFPTTPHGILATVAIVLAAVFLSGLRTLGEALEVEQKEGEQSVGKDDQEQDQQGEHGGGEETQPLEASHGIDGE